MKFKNRNKLLLGKVFLWTYAIFLLVASVHFHTIDIKVFHQIEKNSCKGPVTASDLSDDGIYLCWLNLFTNSILDYDFGSKQIIQILPGFENFLTELKIPHINLDNYNFISPRAPPVLS